MRPTFAIFLFILICIGAPAQTDSLAFADSTKTARKTIYSGPRRASILSAILPGAGQVYNRKYWKVPVIYAGLGSLGYFFYVNQQDVRYYSRNLAAIYDDASAGTENMTPFDAQQLIELKHAARRLRDFSALGFVLVYLVNIIDANVDAHLKTFDVSDDLSLQLLPAALLRDPAVRGVAAGITLKIKFN